MAANAAVDLTTLASAKAFLAAAGDAAPVDAVLEPLITGVSAQLQAYLCRRLPSQSYTIRESGRGGYAMMMPNYPVTAVTSLKISRCEIEASPDGDVPGFMFDDHGIWLRGYIFARGIQNIEVSYTAGYLLADMPADIVLACHQAIRAGVQSLGHEFGAVFLKAGDTEIDFGAVSILAQQCVSPAITSMLNPHRRVTPV